MTGLRPGTVVTVCWEKGGRSPYPVVEVRIFAKPQLTVERTAVQDIGAVVASVQEQYGIALEPKGPCWQGVAS